MSTPLTTSVEATEPALPAKRARIIAGAARIFTRDGYEGASMADIARDAGVSKGTLYNYFDGKSSLFEAWIIELCDGKLAAVFGADETQSASAAEGLRQIGRRLLRLIFSPDALVIERLLATEGIRFPHLARTFLRIGPDRAKAHLGAWLRRTVEQGELRIENTDFAAEQFIALCQTSFFMPRRLGLMTRASEAEIEHVVAASVEMFLAFYGKPPRQASTQPPGERLADR